ncbi:MAG: HAMP domain-containing histidine kinase [Bacteroidetes bacterium]|jgi:signal transduction histidine kinase|nr:HAMP domain-containing histidine kinase [Bacteroidota bacterium]
MSLAAAGIIVVNVYSVKILSGARAYVNGESEYSKGQKDASAYLINYINLHNKTDYFAFKNSIAIPKGDHIARVGLTTPPVDYKTVKEGLLAGKNHPEDIDNMIWLFETFKNVTMFKKAIEIWTEGDEMIYDLDQIGASAHDEIVKGTMSEDAKRAMIAAINKNSAALTIKEDAFSETLGNISRQINTEVLVANVLITLIIVLCSLTSAAIMIRNLSKSQKKILEQNERLQLINAGLDKFVFNVTHDLRSPLASIMGLINLMDDETDLEQIKEYTIMIKESLERQDRFINEMLTFIKSKHTGVNKTECSLSSIVDNVIAQNSHHNGGKRVHFYKELELTQIQSDALKLQVILNNLVSNSIKYSDAKKTEQWVKVKSYRHDKEVVIEVEDNGLGIRPKDQDRIFDKFYMSGDNKKSSGIGLYLVKDAVTQLDGKIEVRSEPGVCSKFRVIIPFS